MLPAFNSAASRENLSETPLSREQTFPLYVHLSASQTRKRLKGHGFGVRRVETAGNHRAVIFHTATGRHLDTLRSLFADVHCESSEEASGEPLGALRNPGPTSVGWLREVGIQTKADLLQTGAIVAWKLVKAIQPTASLNLLWALVAAIEDRDLRDLTDAEKEQLKSRLQGLERL